MPSPVFVNIEENYALIPFFLIGRISFSGSGLYAKTLDDNNRSFVETEQNPFIYYPAFCWCGNGIRITTSPTSF